MQKKTSKKIYDIAVEISCILAIIGLWIIAVHIPKLTAELILLNRILLN